MIREGKASRSLGDIQVGDHFWLKYERTNDTLVADAIHIMKPAHIATSTAAGKKAK